MEIPLQKINTGLIVPQNHALDKEFSKFHGAVLKKTGLCDIMKEEIFRAPAGAGRSLFEKSSAKTFLAEIALDGGLGVRRT